MSKGRSGRKGGGELMSCLDVGDEATRSSSVRWGLGQRDRDKSLLLFVALNDRASQIILGDDIDSDAGIAASERIMRDTIVSHVRAGRPTDTITSGRSSGGGSSSGRGASGRR